MPGYHHGDLKAALIHEGLKLLDTEGYEAFSLRKVAKACGVSQTAPYRHFKDKDELIIAIAMEAMRAFNDSLSAPVHEYPNDPKRQITEMGVGYVRFFVENPAYLRLLFLSDLRKRLNQRICAEQDHFNSGHPFSTFFYAVRRYKAGNPNEKRNEEELLLYFWGVVHGIAILIANGDFSCEGDYLDLVKRVLYSMDTQG